MSADVIRRAVAGLPLPERHALVAQIGADVALVERVTAQTAWLALRLRAARSKL